MNNKHVLLGALLALTLPHLVGAQMRESFDAQVPVAPSPVAIDGGQWLIYELHLTNFTQARLDLRKVEVLDGTQDRVLLALDEQARIVEPGRREIVYLEVPQPEGKAPASLRHRIEYRQGGEAALMITGSTAVRAPARLALGPPLRGGPWAAIYHWQWPRGHRRVFYTLDGRARLPGRFAIDWVLQDEQGRQSRGDPDLVTNALGYGADVLAVAHARVVEVRDGVPESPRVSANPAHSLEEKPGNYVALDLGDGRFAVYEHLKPNSIRVKRGDRVRRGQVLASLGFTGDSTGPHLHFHVADSPSPLLAEGLPFVFDSFSVESGATAGLRQRERPAPNAIVTFAMDSRSDKLPGRAP